MIVFNNFNLINLENAKIDNLSNNFNFLHNFKEFFINNNINISNDFNKTKLFKKFDYIYLGYDIKGNLIYYRSGKNRIKSIDILDLFNIFNKQIVRLYLKMENIDILFNSDKSILKIINLNNNNNDNNMINDKILIQSINNIINDTNENIDFKNKNINNIKIINNESNEEKAITIGDIGNNLSDVESSQKSKSVKDSLNLPIKEIDKREKIEEKEEKEKTGLEQLKNMVLEDFKNRINEEKGNNEYN
jgi:hypothetical protein